ncbi:MAG: efflux RND transporter periplasmic adaptor subunit [Spirochaetes bacterium]|nr:efflux RND transporter periplasmic adaptor subunit [Spirochaetota bacterium]
MKKSLLIAFILVSALSAYIGMEVQRRKMVVVPSGAPTRPSGGTEGMGNPGGVGKQNQTGTTGGAPSEPNRTDGGSGTGKTTGVRDSSAIGSGKTSGSGDVPPSGSPVQTSPVRRGAVSVEVVPIQIGTIRDVGNFSGTLEARSQFVLSTKIAGRLKSIFVDAGDEVRKGQVVALLEEEDYKYPYEQAVADLEATRANLEDAQGALETSKREYERAKSLFESKIISAAELDSYLNQYRKAEATVKVVQAQVKQREAALAIAKDRLDSTRIVATWESEEPTRVIGERFANPGTLLRANDPICSVLDISSLVGIVNVTELGYTKIRPGQRATIRVEILPGREFPGTVDRVTPYLNPSTRQATVRITVPNRSRELKPGMFIQVEVEFARRQQVQILPEACIVTREDRLGVFLVNPQEGKVKFIPVQAGIREGGKVEILSPSLIGSVVITGQHLLQDGSSVQVAGRGKP